MPADPDDAITRRRRQRADLHRVYLLAGTGALAGLVLGCCGGISATLLLTPSQSGGVATIAALTGPSENREGKVWTLAELRDHLARYRQAKAELKPRAVCRETKPIRPSATPAFAGMYLGG